MNSGGEKQMRFWRSFCGVKEANSGVKKKENLEKFLQNKTREFWGKKCEFGEVFCGVKEVNSGGKKANLEKFLQNKK